MKRNMSSTIEWAAIAVFLPLTAWTIYAGGDIPAPLAFVRDFSFPVIVGAYFYGVGKRRGARTITPEPTQEAAPE